jgi:hypothetical protein
MTDSLATDRDSAVTSFLRCFVCNSELPLRFPRANERATQFECAGCGSSFAAVLVPDAPESLRGNIRSEPKVEPAIPMPRGRATSAPAPRGKLICPLQTVQTRTIDSQIEQGSALTLARQGEAFNRHHSPRGTQPFSSTLCDEIGATLNASVKHLETLFHSLNASIPVSIEHAREIAGLNLAKAAEDLDLYVTFGINPPDSGYPHRQGLHTGLLAMAIGASLGLDEPTLGELGLGCVVHDSGMLRVQNDLYRGAREVPTREFMAIAKHPIYSLDLLSPTFADVPNGARMVVYQMHERVNGSGYPRGRSALSIHLLAKISAVADAYVALVSPRPHREGMAPYFALKQILIAARDGLFDQTVVRALLNTISLFPLGSYVGLNDGSIAKVVRSNGGSYDRPVVEVQRRSGLPVKPDWIDLSQSQELKVIRALASPQGAW